MKLDQGVIPGACLHLRRAIVNMENQVHVLNDLNDLSRDVRMWAQLSLVLSRITRLTEGRTDGQTAFSWLDCVACNASSAVKTLLCILRLLQMRDKERCESSR